MRNYKKVSKCPDSAKEIINLANSLPAGFEFSFDDFPNFDTAKQKKSPFYEEVSKIPPDILANAWCEYFIKDGENNFFYPLSTLTDYINRAISCRRILAILCLDTSGFAKHTFGGKPVLKGASIKNSYFTLDSDTGFIELAAHYPLSIIMSEKMDARRFRNCPVCKIFFWAKKMDAKTCGKIECTEKLSGKKYHIENKDEINRKKRKKYYEKEKIEFCDLCIRPLNTHSYSDCDVNKGK